MSVRIRDFYEHIVYEFDGRRLKPFAGLYLYEFDG